MARIPYIRSLYPAVFPNRSIDHVLFLVVAFPLLSQHKHDAPLSQASHMPTPSTSRDHSISLRDSASAFRPVDRPRPAAYVDRDDPRYERELRGSSTSNRSQLDHRRRSRSPDVSRNTTTQDLTQHAASHASTQAAQVSWKDLRQPVGESYSHRESSSKPSTSSFRPIGTAPNKRLATDISKWNRKQAELRANESAVDAAPDVTRQSDSGHPVATNTVSETRALSANEPQWSKPGEAAVISETERVTLDSGLDPAQMTTVELSGYDYKDEARIACLLCQRKFKSVDTLYRHTSESQLHKDNLSNLETCRQGIGRKRESLTDMTSSTSQAESKAEPTEAASSPNIVPTPAYRDRASERRAVFGADTPSKPNKPNAAPKVFEGPKAIDVEIVQSAPEKPIDGDNIGSKLLAMMGWSQGQGLGTKGQGRTDIVETKIYKPGAGLGSSAPTDTATHDASQNATPSRKAGANVAFTGYLDRAKDREY